MTPAQRGPGPPEGVPAVRLQPLTRARIASLGSVGTAWTQALPGVLATLERRWSITVGRSLPGGSASYVAAARRGDGTDCVVKVAVPPHPGSGDGLAEQAATLREADGRGYVALLAADLEVRALLLERLGSSLQHDPRPPEEQLVLLADTLRRAWLPPGERRPEATAHRVHRAVRHDWARLGQPCSERVAAQALVYAEQLREVPPADLVVVHGDAHPGNLLAVPHARPGAETGFCLVDPDSFVGDRAYDLGAVLRDWTGRLRGDDPVAVLRGYADVLASRTGVDPERIWRWGFVERVRTGLHVLGFGSPAVGRPLLASAERLLG